MTKSQKEINDVMVQVLEEVIFPRFDQLDEKVDYTNRRLDVLVDEFKDHDKRITKLEVRAGFAVN